MTAPDTRQSVALPEASDDKNIVTPYAFGVSDSLLGTPLATPLRRGLAILIDLVLIGVLTSLNSISAAGVAAWLCFKASDKDELRFSKGKTRTFTRGLGYFLLLGFLLSAFERGNEEISAIWVPEALTDTQPQVMPPAQSSSPLQSTHQPQITSEGTPPSYSKSELQSQLKKALSESEELTINLSGEDEPNSPDSETEGPPSLVNYIQGFLGDLGLSFGFSAMYFTVMTAWYHGQTPGKRVLGIKVIKLDGSSLGLWDAFGRYGGYGAGFATGLLGFAQMYWDNNRQAIQDKISETLVIDMRRARKNDWHQPFSDSKNTDAKDPDSNTSDPKASDLTNSDTNNIDKTNSYKINSNMTHSNTENNNNKTGS